MPELPEVETIARGLNQRLAGDAIDSVWLGSKPEPLKSKARDLVATLESKQIARVWRMGKHVVFDLENGVDARPALKKKKIVQAKTLAPTSPTQWIVHLGMTGQLLICNPEQPVENHTHAMVRLASGRELRLVEPRRFGRLSVAKGFDASGIEPLEIAPDKFAELFRSRKTPIKSALLNQKLLRGVGNISADESLFRAGIRPRRRTASLSRDELRRLHMALQEVLKEAIALGGSSISDYVDANGDEGFFQLQHRVYGREGEPCLVCKKPVKRVVIAGRSSHYCPKCQR
jgi:formamidopyrimidine-DNA glycosylase